MTYLQHQEHSRSQRSNDRKTAAPGDRVARREQENAEIHRMANDSVHPSINQIAVVQRRRRHAEVPGQIALRSPCDRATTCYQQNSRHSRENEHAIARLSLPPSIQWPSDDNRSEQQELAANPEPVRSDRALNAMTLTFDGHLLAFTSVGACYGECLITLYDRSTPLDNHLCRRMLSDDIDRSLPQRLGYPRSKEAIADGHGRQ